MKEDYEPEPYVVKRPRRGLLVVAGAIALVLVALVWASQREAGDGARFGGVPGGAPAPEISGGSVGTTGTEKPDAEGDSGPGGVVPPRVIQELDTITGSVDGQQLIGQRVDLHVAVQSVPNEVAFWVGERDNRVLVVLGRDNRSGAQRQRGVPSGHGISPVHAGQQATISGSVQRLPRAEEMSSWRLTEGEFAELLDRKLYIRADSVTTNGHGTHGGA
jgi:hypothetical protein